MEERVRERRGSTEKITSLDKESKPTKYDNKDHFDAFRLS